MSLYAKINKKDLKKETFGKQANHVSPQMHKEVDKYISDPTQTHSQVIKASETYLLARRLLQDLPIVPTSERIFELAQEIEIGLFDDLGPVEKAEANWDAWKERTKEILKAQKILIAAVNTKNEKVDFKKIEETEPKKEDSKEIDYYAEAEKVVNSLKNIEKYKAYNKIFDEIYSYIYSNKEYAVAIIEIALKEKIIDKIDYQELLTIIGVDPDIKG